MITVILFAIAATGVFGIVKLLMVASYSRRRIDEIAAMPNRMEALAALDAFDVDEILSDRNIFSPFKWSYRDYFPEEAA